jgi:hypothetical protein
MARFGFEQPVQDRTVAGKLETFAVAALEKPGNPGSEREHHVYQRTRISGETASIFGFYVLSCRSTI